MDLVLDVVTRGPFAVELDLGGICVCVWMLLVVGKSVMMGVEMMRDVFVGERTSVFNGKGTSPPRANCCRESIDKPAKSTWYESREEKTCSLHQFVAEARVCRRYILMILANYEIYQIYGTRNPYP